MLTLRTLYEEGSAALLAAGIEEAGLDARYLLLAAFEMELGDYLRNADRELSEAQFAGKVTLYRQLILRRSAREPLQHILGETEFMGLLFRVNRDVLIPRQDTETLVEQVLSDCKERELRVLDLCTGSGCIAVSLAVLGGYREVVAADLSEAALSVAAENAARNGAAERVHFVRGDLFAALSAKMRFDVIVSNPPYIPSAEIEKLLPEVRDFDPRMALDGAEDGLLFYRRIAAECGEWLSAGGRLYLEIGAEQAADVTALLSEAGFCGIETIRDLCGRDRVIRAKKPPET